MFTITRRISSTDVRYIEVPALASALVIAETCYKFHSFLLEASAFLATWWVFGAVLTTVRRVAFGPPSQT